MASRSLSEKPATIFFTPFTQHAVRERQPVHGEVRFEQAPIRAEALDRVEVVAALRGNELVGSRWTVGEVPPEAVVGHRETAELGDDVVAARDLLDVAPPPFEDRLPLVGVRADSERCAEMVEDHHRVRHRAGQCEELLVLEVVVPGVVREVAGTEPGDAGAERRIFGEPGRRLTRDCELAGSLGARQRIADPAKQSAAGFDVRVEHVIEVREPQVGVGDDAGDHALALLGRGGREFGLADRRELGGSVGAIGGAAFDEHRLLDTVAASEVGLELRERVRERAAGRPEVVMRVDDPLTGIDHLFLDERAPRIRAGRRSAHLTRDATAGSPAGRKWIDGRAAGRLHERPWSFRGCTKTKWMSTTRSSFVSSRPQLPRLADLPLTRIEAWGTDHAIFRLGRDLSVRVPKIGWASKQGEKESQWLPRLAPHLPVEVPVPVAMGEPAEGYPFVWYVAPWLEGANPRLDGSLDLHQLTADLAAFVLALQRIDTAGAPTARPGQRGGPLEAADEFTRVRAEELRGEADVDALLAVWDAGMHAPPWDGPGRWVHGDLSDGNLLVRDGRLSGVIDWGGLIAGDPAVELMVAWSLFDSETRAVYRDALGFVDDAMWLRSRAWAASAAIQALPYYRETNPDIVARSWRAVREVLADFERA